MFKIDYAKLIAWMLPARKRRPVLYAWLGALCAPAVIMYNTFLAKRAIDLYNLQHDSRVFSLRAMLNDRFDNADRRITIADGFAFDRIYIFQPGENKSLFLGSVPLHNEGDYGDTGVDFIVNVPQAITLSDQDLIEMEAKVKYYKLASKRFLIYRTI
jgi:hypothetical protein